VPHKRKEELAREEHLAVLRKGTPLSGLARLLPKFRWKKKISHDAEPSTIPFCRSLFRLLLLAVVGRLVSFPSVACNRDVYCPPWSKY
jgi:hypothetical protein